ncbi:proteasome subunit alpha type 6 [Fusarium langsethiae]|uniref:Proteasome subunit alpha type 6 n=1 Tax=Fusarium langsethiae TaxID=179993 RepID=A0A0M9F1B0_FUSLA|nr:proteasome subunit alpha type 6 [Fusarium langsethiae]GKU01193.1 unnamed protein product [Fusarium langsethiae]GKU12613.1 unnamed protein product [Fusarium langsethiae]
MSGQVPAWKRLGLKLKQPSDAPEPSFGHPTSSSSTPIKRKFDAPPPSSSSQAAKRQKSVSFADAPSNNNNPKFSRTPAKPAKQSKAKSKGPAKKPKPQVPTDLKPALEYLSLWKTARDSWKFNKNHQSNLIKHVFDADGIPASDIETFYDYIQDLKGFVRMRLRETACEVRDQDQSDGAKAFPEGTKDLEATQQRYEEVLAKYLSQPVGSKRKGFTEVDYLSDSEEDEVIVRRLVKRMRAELVIDELSDSDETEATTTSSQTIASSDSNATATKNTEKSVKPDGVPGKRRRKLRVNVDDSDSSSSESDSDSDDDDTSSSGSSSSEDESEKKAPATARSYRKPGEEDSSDSSSSSDDASSDNGSSDDDSDSE